MNSFHVVALVTAIALFFHQYIYKPEPVFISKPILLSNISNALQIQHKDRKHSGGFSSMWLDKNCENLVFISDYSQAEDLVKLNQQVIRSQWFHVKLTTNEDGTLKDLQFVQSGRVRQPNGEFLMGATESMTEISEGILTSLDDRGDLWVYPD